MDKSAWEQMRPQKCDLCGKPFSKTYIDGSTKRGPWAYMCESCHKIHGVGFGLGRGQQFDYETGKKIQG